MLTADGEVCFYFVFINHKMLDAWQTVCKTMKNWRGKEHSAPLRRPGKILAMTGSIPAGSWIWLKYRKEVNRNDKRCSCPSSWGHSQKLAKTPIPNCLYQVFDRLENLFQTTNLGQTDALNAKSRRTKNSTSTENAYREKKRPATSRIRRLNNF